MFMGLEAHSRMVGRPFFGAKTASVSLVFFALAAISIGVCGDGYSLFYVALGFPLIVAGVAAMNQYLASVRGFRWREILRLAARGWNAVTSEI